MTCGIREFYLDEIDAWQAGKRGTPGCPPEGERYALRMRETVKLLERDLAQHEKSCSTCRKARLETEESGD